MERGQLGIPPRQGFAALCVGREDGARAALTLMGQIIRLCPRARQSVPIAAYLDASWPPHTGRRWQPVRPDFGERGDSIRMFPRYPSGPWKRRPAGSRNATQSSLRTRFYRGRKFFPDRQIRRQAGRLDWVGKPGLSQVFPSLPIWEGSASQSPQPKAVKTGAPLQLYGIGPYVVSF